MTDIDQALAEIKRRATHFDSTGYITVHEDALREALAEMLAKARAELDQVMDQLDWIA